MEVRQRGLDGGHYFGTKEISKNANFIVPIKQIIFLWSCEHLRFFNPWLNFVMPIIVKNRLKFENFSLHKLVCINLVVSFFHLLLGFNNW